MGGKRGFFRKMSEDYKRRWKFMGFGFRWKRLRFQLQFMDKVVFRIMYVVEAIVLVATVCFFYLFCGCHL